MSTTHAVFATVYAIVAIIGLTLFILRRKRQEHLFRMKVRSDAGLAIHMEQSGYDYQLALGRVIFTKKEDKQND